MRFWEWLMREGACDSGCEWVGARSLRECVEAEWPIYIVGWANWLAWAFPQALHQDLLSHMPADPFTRVGVSYIQAWMKKHYAEIVEALDIEA